MFRSVIALLAGFAILTFTVLIATVVAAMSMPLDPASPSAQFQAVNIAYTALAGVFGGYATATLAPERPSGHSMVLALMIFVMQAYNVMSPQAGYPRSHFVWLLILCPVAAIAGGTLRERQFKNRPKKP